MDTGIGGTEHTVLAHALRRWADAVLGVRERRYWTPTLGGVAIVPPAGPPPNADRDGDTTAVARRAAHLAIVAYVVERRANGVTPQGLLVDVKAATRDALPRTCDEDTRRALVDDVVRWTIEAFYDDGGHAR